MCATTRPRVRGRSHPCRGEPLSSGIRCNSRLETCRIPWEDGCRGTAPSGHHGIRHWARTARKNACAPMIRKMKFPSPLPAPSVQYSIPRTPNKYPRCSSRLQRGTGCHVAHLDDDLLFVEPSISERLHAGWCVTVVHLIGDANGHGLTTYRTARRERVSRMPSRSRPQDTTAIDAPCR